MLTDAYCISMSEREKYRISEIEQSREAVAQRHDFLQPLPGGLTCHHLSCRSPTRISSTTPWRFNVSSPLLQESHADLFNHFLAV